MAGIIGHILPLALGVALSSVPIVVMVLILLSPRGRWSGLTYLIGAFIGLSALTALFAAAATLLPPLPASQKSPLIGSIEIVLGLALLALAAWRLHRRSLRRRAAAVLAADAASNGSPGDGATADASTATAVPAWMTRLTALGPVPSFGVGFVLMLRPKNLLLTIASGVAIATGGADAAGMVVAGAVFVVLGISTIAAPIIFSVADPARTARPLEQTRLWIERNSAIVTTIVLIVLGTVIVGGGIARF